jgi:hypothetical protein
MRKKIDARCWILDSGNTKIQNPESSIQYPPIRCGVTEQDSPALHE